MPEPIYTKKGDKGETDLLSGERVKKLNPRVEVYGTIDELFSQLGVVKVFSSEFIEKHILDIQKTLFFINAELATKKDENKTKTINSEEVKKLEEIIDNLQEKLPKLKSFVVPGGTKSAALIDLSRAICRRAERRLLKLNETTDLNQAILKYINRLSDFLFVLARYVNQFEGDGDLMISRKGIYWKDSD